MLIQEFHSKLNLRTDQSTLFLALRRLRSLSGVKMFAAAESGWIVWADDTKSPTDDDGSFRFEAAMA